MKERFIVSLACDQMCFVCMNADQIDGYINKVIVAIYNKYYLNFVLLISKVTRDSADSRGHLEMRGTVV